jgi:hypothetical protein
MFSRTNNARVKNVKETDCDSLKIVLKGYTANFILVQSTAPVIYARPFGPAQYTIDPTSLADPGPESDADGPRLEQSGLSSSLAHGRRASSGLLTHKRCTQNRHVPHYFDLHIPLFRAW